jgi:eukaryotic-like serine/threonine-protein kinase
VKTNDPVVASLIGQVVAERYRVDALIDQGAMGQVFLAEHILMRKRVALKVLRPELTRVPEVLARFEREAMAAANISHPNVVAATDFGKLPSGSVFLVLEFVEGRTLRSVLAEGPMNVARALGIAEQIASALQAAHALSIVHRDLKPENVMLVARSDGSDWVKVLDFGVAKVPLDIGESSGTPPGGAIPLTKAGMVFGTPDYMSPEQALGQEADPRADLFSLGVILYELLAGVRPFRSTDELGVLGQQLSEGMPSFAVRAPDVQVPAVVEEFVGALLVTEINARVQTAGEAITRLRLLIESGVGRRPHSDAPPRSLPAIPRTPQSDVRSSQVSLFERTFSGLPEPLNLLPIWVFAAVLCVFLLGVFGLTWAVLHPPAEVKPNQPQVSAPIPATLPARPAGTDPKAPLASPEQLADAVKAGSLALTALSEQFPRDGQVHLALARALLKDGDRVAAVSSVRKAVEADPGLTSDRYVAGVLWDAAQRPTSSDAAFELIKGPMRAAGADIAFDLAVTQAVPTNVAARARAWLRTKGFERISTPEASIAAGLLLAPNCKARQALVKRAENVGDARSVPLLQQFQSGAGCAPPEGPDCNACLKGAPAITTALEAIRGRNTQVRPPVLR